MRTSAIIVFLFGATSLLAAEKPEAGWKPVDGGLELSIRIPPGLLSRLEDTDLYIPHGPNGIRFIRLTTDEDELARIGGGIRTHERKEPEAEQQTTVIVEEPPAPKESKEPKEKIIEVCRHCGKTKCDCGDSWVVTPSMQHWLLLVSMAFNLALVVWIVCRIRNWDKRIEREFQRRRHVRSETPPQPGVESHPHHHFD